MHSILILANAFFIIRDIFHLYLFASPLKFNISFGDAVLLPAPQNKAYVARGYFRLFSPVSSTQEQQLRFQPLLEQLRGVGSSLCTLHGAWGQRDHRDNMGPLGAALRKITYKKAGK